MATQAPWRQQAFHNQGREQSKASTSITCLDILTLLELTFKSNMISNGGGVNNKRADYLCTCWVSNLPGADEERTFFPKDILLHYSFVWCKKGHVSCWTFLQIDLQTHTNESDLTLAHLILTRVLHLSRAGGPMVTKSDNWDYTAQNHTRLCCNQANIVLCTCIVAFVSLN